VGLAAELLSMAAVPEALNPYIAGSPVTDAKMFFGREDIFDWIEHSLAGQYADHILVIHGQRRVGKTSVLKQLPHRLPDRYIPVFFDLQGRTRTTLDRFLWWLARETVRVLKQDRQVILPLPEQEAFAQDPEHMEGRFLPELRRLLPDHNLLLTFDEFDTLEEAEVREALGRPLTETLRRLMGREGLNFIFSIGSSGRKLENMQASYTEFFKAALYRKVSFLGQQQAYDLITRPVEGLLEYQPEAVQAIYAITSGHPYFTQLICHELFALCQKTAQRTVSPAEVTGVLDDVIERGTVNLKFVWDEASDLERWALAGLAQREAGASTRALGQVLSRQRVRFDDPDLESALVRLRDKDVLTAKNDFVIQLMRRWLQKNRPLDQVRDELVERNPIASRYLEIGLEYLDTGLEDKALESFGQVLEIDPQHLGAQVRIAEVHLRQGRHAEAAAEFERALAIDEEDVAARSGLCDARLALGDQALARGRAKEALAAFRQVMGINPEHGEARQRMADLARQAAEKALGEGRDEQALASFEEALGYTPEDQALEARCHEVQAEMKARLLAALPAKALSLATAERWDEAFATWQDYLGLEPPDPERAQAEIERLREAQALATTYAQAQAALARKDYDEATSILKGIVAQDETYKDSTRLLLQAIEARRRARPRWKWKPIQLSRRLRLGLAGGLAVIALGAAIFAAWDSFIGPRIRGLGAAAPPAASDIKVCLLTQASGITDQYLEPIWRAIEAAQSTYGIEGAYVEGTDETNAAERIETFLGEGCGLVVSFRSFGDAMRAAASDHPEARFLLVDHEAWTDLPNLLALQFKSWEAAFLAGYLGAGMTETGRVGTFGGEDDPFVTDYMDGFARGVGYYNDVHSAEVVVLGRNLTLQTGLFINTFEDPELARQASEDLLDQGADILFPVAWGITPAAANAAQGRGRAYVIGVDLDWAEIYPELGDVFLSSAQKDYGEMVTEAIRRVVDGDFPGEVLAGNVQNGGVRLAPFHELASQVPADLAAELEALRKEAPMLSVLSLSDSAALSPTAVAAAATALPTATAAPAVSTLRPTPTATAAPKWVTDFAQPILDAIAGREPDFQDDFDDTTGLWKAYPGRSCGLLEISQDGELALQRCWAYRENIDYPDIVAEVDGRFLPESATEGPEGSAYWDVVIRETEFGHGYSVRIRYDGVVEVYGVGDFPGAAHSALQSNHLVLIAKGAQFALFINDRPLTYFEDDTSRWGTIVFELPRGAEYVFADRQISVALDNFKLWDVSDVSLP
jgi:basic membrane protein A